MTVPIGIIASDLTGAMDTGAAFAESSHDTIVLLTLERVAAASNVVLVTDSAAVAPAEAYARVRRAAALLSGRLLFKKMDSTLRGNIGPELRAVLDEADTAKAIVCPALPRQGRTVRGGVALLDGVPVHLTPCGSHPVTPCRDSDIRSVLQRAGVASNLAGLDDVRRGPGHLRQVLAGADMEAIVVDAETDDDLLTLAHALPPDEQHPVVCGSSGLAAAMAVARGRRRDSLHSSLDACSRKALAVIGSRNPTTVAHVRALAGDPGCTLLDIDAAALCAPAHQDARTRWCEVAAEALMKGRTAVLTTSLSPLVVRYRGEVARRLGDLAAAVADRVDVGLFLLSGGATAWAVCRRLSIEALSLLGEREQGVVVAEARGNTRSGVNVITKAGGFGDAGTLARVLRPPS